MNDHPEGFVLVSDPKATAVPIGRRRLLVEGYRPPALQHSIFEGYTAEPRALHRYGDRYWAWSTGADTAVHGPLEGERAA